MGTLCPTRLENKNKFNWIDSRAISLRIGCHYLRCTYDVTACPCAIKWEDLDCFRDRSLGRTKCRQFEWQALSISLGLVLCIVSEQYTSLSPYAHLPTLLTEQPSDSYRLLGPRPLWSLPISAHKRGFPQQHT